MSDSTLVIPIVLVLIVGRWAAQIWLDRLNQRNVLAHAGALLDGPLDHIPAHALPPRLLKGGEKPGIPGRIRAAELRGDHDFLDQFTDNLPFFQVGDFTFSLEPLATHLE